MAPIKRGWLGALVDQLFAWMNKLPSESCSYTIENVRIPMEDGLELEADLYQPIGTKPVGTLLVRSIWPCDCGLDEETVVVHWLIATVGGSYLGFVQWALLSNPPADMKAAVIKTGPHDFSNFIWGTGAFNSDAVAWADVLTHMRRGEGFISLMLSLRSQKSRLRPVLDSVPLLDAVDKYFAGNSPEYLRHMITQPDRTDSFWQLSQHDDALEKANIPILLVTGWYDLNLQQTMKQYTKLNQRGCNVALVVGPWTHLGAQRNTIMEPLGWLDEHLAGRPNDTGRSPVRIFVTGIQEWRDLPKWPPSAVPHELFLCPDKKLSNNPPPADASDSVFKFDPADPTPAIGVPELFDNGNGKKEDTALATRSDVLVFITEPLDRDLEVCGKPSLELRHSSNHPYVDLLVLLSEVDSQGISHSITERYLRLDVNRGEDPLNVTLYDCAHTFRKGTRIRLLIAGGSHPRYIRNLGAGDNPGTGSTLRAAFHTIQHKRSAISKLILPETTPASQIE